MDSSSSDVTRYFPHPAILATHPLGQPPTYATLKPAMTQLNANATSVPSTGGDGLLGHLVLTIGEQNYQAQSIGNVAYPLPAPVLINPIIPAGSTGTMITELRRQHNDKKKAFQRYYAVDTALKQQIIDATDDMYLSTLKHPTHGYTLVRTHQIVDHLFMTPVVTSKLMMITCMSLMV